MVAWRASAGRAGRGAYRPPEPLGTLDTNLNTISNSLAIYCTNRAHPAVAVGGVDGEALAAHAMGSLGYHNDAHHAVKPAISAQISPLPPNPHYLHLVFLLITIMEPELFPLAVLIDELRHDDIQVRVEAMSRLTTIARALGEERTRTELVPFLEEVVQEDEDEILAVLAEELAKFVPLVGGPEYQHVLIPVLFRLSACEEPTVRDAAVQVLLSIGANMNKEQMSTHFVPMVHRLATADWFSSRMSAAALLAAGVPYDPSILALTHDLATDDAPMVRRAAATHIPEVVAALPDTRALDLDQEPFSDIYQSLTTDDQDSVRLLSVNLVIALAKRIQDKRLVDAARALLTDKSWRVRYMAADSLEELAKTIIPLAGSPEMFVTLFVQLCQDTEAEVRTAVAKHVVGFCKLLDQQTILDDIIPQLAQLVHDPSEHVREALASQVSCLPSMLGKDLTQEHLLPLFLHMLRDSHSEVRLQIISNLQVVNSVIGIDELSKSLLPAINDLAKDKQWRVLLAIIEYTPLLAEQLGVEFFNKELVPLVMRWLWDPVWAIRDAAAQKLVNLGEVFGPEWLETEIVPKIVGLDPQANYLMRLTSLLAMKTLTPALSAKCLRESVLPFVLDMFNDPVPNIRFNCAKTLQAISTSLGGQDATIKDTIVPVLKKHAEDNDVDVRFFVNAALQEIEVQ